ncbi:MAG: NAD(P)/FAD-dependent oxidoreductase [Bdellovibrionota bacterium]
MQSSETKYDAIVVGAGIAGMMAASDLNHRGYKVLVLEHNHQAGGLMAGIWRRGFYFDAGCQSFENMNIVFPLLKQYGLERVAKFHRVRYRLKMPEIDTIVMSLKQTREDFKKAYPKLAQGFDRVFDMHDLTSAFIKRVFVKEAIPFVERESPTAFASWLSRALPWTGSLKTLMLDDFEDWYKRVLPESGVRDLLAHCGYSRMNVFVASAFWHLWAEDYWYPEGGYQLWFDQWVKALQEKGVEFKFKSTVTEFEKSGKRVDAVITRKNERFEAKEVVFAGDYKQAVFQLIGSEHFPQSEIAKLEAAKHSDPLVCVYLGLDLPREKLKEIVKSSHIFYFPDYGCRTELDLNDPEAHKKTFLEVTSHCIDDPSLAPEGKSAVVLQAFTRCEWLDHWRSEGQWDKRSIEYKELKRKVGDQIVGVFEGIFPDVRKHIEYIDVGSPLSAYRFTKNQLGGSCGFELNWRNFPFLNPLAHTKTPLSNLHMAGHFTVWPGAVPTAALSGKIAAVRAHRRLAKTASRAKTWVKNRIQERTGATLQP